MADLYFLAGNFESEKAASLVRELKRRRGFEIRTHRIELNNGKRLINLYRKRGIKGLPCLIVGIKRYMGFQEIREYFGSLGALVYQNIEIPQEAWQNFDCRHDPLEF